LATCFWRRQDCSGAERKLRALPGDRETTNISLTFTLPAGLVNWVQPVADQYLGRPAQYDPAMPRQAWVYSVGRRPTTLSATGARWVFIAATVNPAANQAAGGYIATATLTVAYF
jgi:hypothetical protein